MIPTARKRFVRALIVAAAGAAVAAGGVTGIRALADPAVPAEPAPGGQTAGSVYAGRTAGPAALIPGAGGGRQYSYWSVGADERMHLSTAVLLEPTG